MPGEGPSSRVQLLPWLPVTQNPKMKAISNVFELADEELDEFEPSAKSFTSRGEVDVVQIDEDEVEDDSEHEWTQTPTSSPPMT